MKSMSEKDVIVGVDLGATKIRTIVCSPAGEVIAVDHRATRGDEGPATVIAEVAKSVEKVLDEAGVSPGGVLGLGIGAPGPIDVPNGIIVTSPNMAGWDNVPLRDALQKSTGLRVYMGNDVNAAALGEHRYGAGRGTRFMLYVAAGSGVGGGIIVGGKLFEGAHGAAAEVGHMTLLPEGPMCGCGNRGHLEALASGRAIEREARDALLAGRRSALSRIAAGNADDITAAMVSEAAKEGDALSLEIIANVAYYLGLGVTSLINICNPELVVLGGGVAKTGDLIFEPVRWVLREQGLEPMCRVEIVPTQLGDNAGPLGAAALVLQANGR